MRTAQVHETFTAASHSSDLASYERGLERAAKRQLSTLIAITFHAG
jgi:hypothetical protein